MVKFRLIVAIVAMTLAILWGTADAATPQNYSRECQGWAHMISAGEDDPLMHMIGCDDGAEANGLYARSDGRCAAIARIVWRDEHNLQTIIAHVKEIEPQCINYDDGSWGLN